MGSRHQAVLELVREMRQLGCEVRQAKNGHKVTLRGAFVGTIPVLPGDHRTMENVRHQLIKKIPQIRA